MQNFSSLVLKQREEFEVTDWRHGLSLLACLGAQDYLSTFIAQLSDQLHLGIFRGQA